ncbi:MAG: PDZ domain-containing protein [bacterium]
MNKSHLKNTTGIVSIILIFSCMGCSSAKLNYKRGWIGGSYLEADNSFIKKISRNYFKDNSDTVPALPNEIEKKQKNAVLVSRIYKNTPLEASGIKEGDLILEINDRPVKNIKTLRKITDDMNPGAEVMFTILTQEAKGKKGVLADH